MKKLSKILTSTKPVKISNFRDINISGIESNSKNVKKNYIFVAIKGEKTDANNFIENAIEAGAVVIVSDKKDSVRSEKIVWIQTKNPRLFLATMCQNYYDNPSKKIKVVGVTGTNGKTTTATLLYNIFTLAGHKSALLSTIENKIGDKTLESSHTTPDPVYLAWFMNEAVKNKCKYLFMECSSHALDQDRIAGVEFKGAIFTNLTRDHLDYHKNFSNYAKAKRKLFDFLPKKSFAISNIDDKYGKYMLQNTHAKKISISTKNKADYFAKVIEKSLDKTNLEINKIPIQTNLIGEFNVYNVLGVYTTAKTLGLKPDAISYAFKKVSAPKGRLEYLKSKKGVYAVIDYAHTPDALLKALKTIKQYVKKENKIISVVGCGGDRDKRKRSMMGHIATKISNVTIFTSDNPRTEDPESIIDDIVLGLNPEKYTRIADRKIAIIEAVKKAKKDDIVLIAGKGHENYQEIAREKIHFSDIEEVKKAFKK
jgi:UDP-N-acetylmuramoyl-L-alanyl-D-glutamate--2,6-diaminopimelate ligase